MGYGFEKGLNEGEAWLNDGETATLMIALYPHNKKNPLRSLLLATRLLFGVIGLGRLFKILKREKAIKRKQPKSDFIHLWYIGVLNSSQNKEKGSKLLQEFLELKKPEKLPIYLETSTVRNLNFYEKNGFQLQHKIEDELPYTLYLFAKKPE